MTSSEPNPPEGYEVHQPSLADEIAGEPEALTKLNRLGAAKQFALMKFIEANYKSLGLDDVSFAVRAVTELGFPLNRSHISNCRKALGIAGNQGPGGNPFSARFSAMERELVEQKKMLDIQAARIEELANQLRLIRQDIKTHAPR